MPQDPTTNPGPVSDNRDSHAPATYVAIALGDQLCAIDVRTVREILDLQPMSQLPTPPPELLGLIDIRGQSIPVIDLALRLGVPRSTDRGGGRILVVEGNAGAPPLGLLVDRVEGVVEIESDAVEARPETLPGWDGSAVAGVTRLNGRLTLLLAQSAVLGHEAGIGIR